MHLRFLLRWVIAVACLSLAVLRAQSTYTSSHIVTTLAGNGTFGTTDATGSLARFNGPSGVAVDSAGNVYVADTSNHTIRKITSGGVVTTLAGTAGTAGTVDGTGTAAQFNSPRSVAVDSAGTVYVADTANRTIRKITSLGVVSTLAGTAGISGSTDATGAAAQFGFPRSIAVDGTGTFLFVADETNSTIRKITISSGAVTTFAGSAGSTGSTDATGAAARFTFPQGVATDSAGNVYVTDSNNHTIRVITSAGVVTTFAGTAGSSGTLDATGTAARFSFPRGIAVDSTGNVYVADSGNHTLRRITAAGVVSTLAGTAGSPALTDGTGAAARFNALLGVAVRTAGTVYVADTNNHAIRLASLGSAPGAPTGATATAGNAQVSVTFTAPAANGGSAITSYTVMASPGGATATGASSPLIVTGLINGTSYTFTVTATNTTGTGVASTATTSTAPAAAPTVTGVTSSNPNATDAGGASVSIQVTFTATVTVTGTPALALNTSPARSATYTGGSGTATLTFTYLVQPGDTSAALDYASTAALTLPGGASIANANGTAATFTLAAPGASGSLGNAKALVIAATSGGATAPYAWGDGGSGQLGNGTTANAKLAVAVTTTGALAGNTVTALSSGENFTLALTSDGRVFAWGCNDNGQLGNGSATASSVPVAVDTSGVLSGKTVAAIATGQLFSLVLTSEGKVYAWGDGRNGQLGNNSATGSNVPVAVSTNAAISGKTITAIAAGDSHSVALGSDGRIYAWGDGSGGQFGDNNATGSSKFPRLVPNTGALAGKTISAISAAYRKVLALASDGTLFEWGYPRMVIDSAGPTFTTLSLPRAVPLTGALAGKTVARISAGLTHNLALTSDGKVFAWGKGNAVGAPSINSGNGSTDPVAVDATGVLSGKTVTAISAGGDFSQALTSEGKVVAWGVNYAGQIGADTGTLPNPFPFPFNMPFPSQPAPAKSPVAVDTSGVLNGAVVTALGSVHDGTVVVIAGSSAVPVVASLTVPADASYGTGAALNFTVTYSAAVTVTGAPSLSLTIGSTARAASYVSGGGTTALLFRYTVQAGETDTDGIALAPSIALNGGTLSGSGGTATTALAPPNLAFVRVDTTAPTPTASLRQSPLAASVTATSVAYRVTFSKAVTGVTASGFTLTATGSASGTIGTLSTVNSSTFDVTVSSLTGNGTLRLDVKSSGSGIADAAGNALTGGFTGGETYTLVPAGSQPAITSAASASGTYGTAFTYTIAASGTPTSFTATGLPPTLTLNATTGAITGTPTLAGNFTVTLAAINASGTGTAALTLSIAKAPLTVTASNTSRFVSSANPNFALTYAGFVNGDTAASLVAAPLATSKTDTLTATGTYAITPQGGLSDNYAFTFVNGTLNVNPIPVTITLGNLVQTYTGASLSPTFTTSPANVPVALTYNGSTTTPTTAGTYAVVVTSVSSNYPGTVSGTFTITKAAQTITLGPIPATTALKDFVGPVQLTATSTSGLTVALTLDVGAAATLNGSNQLVSIGTTGLVTIRANQAGNANYTAGTEVVATFDVVKTNQSLAFTQPANLDFGTAPFALVAAATSGLTPTFTVVSGPATVAGSTLTLTGAGTVLVRASQPGNASFNPAADVPLAFTAFPTTQSITFADFTGATYGDAPITLAATASSGLPVTYTIKSGPATVTGSTLTIIGAGTVAVTASQAGNANYAAAPDFTKNLVVAPKALTATAQNATRALGAANPLFTVAYTGGFVGTDTAANFATPVVVTTTANSLSPVGTYPITPTGGTDTNYTVTLVAGTLTVGANSQTITFSAPPAQIFGNAAFTLGAAASSGLDVTYTINSGQATVAGNLVTLTGVGTVSVSAAQAGNTNYNAATSVTQTFTVAAAAPGAPTGVTATVVTASATVSFTAPANNGGGTITGYTVTASPGGATANGTTSPITVTGLTNGTSYTFTVTATNAGGTGAASVVSSPVTIDTTPPTVVSIVRLLPSTAQITTNPGATFRVTFSKAVNLPTTGNFAVVAVNGSSITGTVTAVTGVSAGVYDVAVTVTGGTGEFRLKVVD